MKTRTLHLSLAFALLALSACVQAAGRPTSVGTATAAQAPAPEQPAVTN